jgi:isocitrate dehydrogenase
LVVDTPLALKLISNRGTKVYPPMETDTDCVDHWRCRFVTRSGAPLDDGLLLDLLARIGAHYTWMHIEKLQDFDGVRGFTLAQGEE